MTEEPNEYGIETHHRQGGDPSQSQLSKAEDDGKTADGTSKVSYAEIHE
jgi:hypothetical protein